jgi:N-acetylneuraminate synthase
MTRSININGFEIAAGKQPFMIAEMSCNHMGDFDQAKSIMRAAKDAGADAVKLQTYTAETLTMDGPQDHFKVDHPLWNNMTLHDLYAKAQTPFEWMAPLFDYGKEIGIAVFSAPFDISAVELLEELGAPIYKIASFESIHIPLIKHVASTGKPLIISTGMANETEISEAVQTARDTGCEDIILLHCISAYPTPIDQANLATIAMLRDKFNVHVGLSDHTKGTLVAELAVGLGACVVEKHMMLNAEDDSLDKAFSLTPEEFADLVKACKSMTTERLDDLLGHDKVAISAMGTAGFSLKADEDASIIFRPSIFVKRALKKGDVITHDDVIIRRPSAGLAPKHLDDVIGMKVLQELSYGDPLSWDILTR